MEVEKMGVLLAKLGLVAVFFMTTHPVAHGNHFHYSSIITLLKERK